MSIQRPFARLGSRASGWGGRLSWSPTSTRAPPVSGMTRTVKAERPENAEASGAGEPAPRPSKGTHRRRRPSTTQVYATTGRDDTQVRALYHAALANLGDTERGDGS